MFSRPLLLLSVATAFSEHSNSDIASNDVGDSQAHSETHSESSLIHSSHDTRYACNELPSVLILFAFLFFFLMFLMCNTIHEKRNC